MTETSFAARVREEREKHGMSQEELARRLAGHGLKLHPTAITRIERGERSVKVDEAQRLADALEVPIANLIVGVDQLTTMQPLTFDALTEATRTRRNRWHGPDTEPWTGADWGNAMGGECGEAQNVVKKLRRHETGTAGASDPPPEELVDMLADELGDVVAYADLLARHYGIDLGWAVARKFNRVSERHGFPERV